MAEQEKEPSSKHVVQYEFSWPEGKMPALPDVKAMEVDFHNAVEKLALQLGAERLIVEDIVESSDHRQKSITFSVEGDLDAENFGLILRAVVDLAKSELEGGEE